jgi:hypothetical protein
MPFCVNEISMRFYLLKLAARGAKYSTVVCRAMRTSKFGFCLQMIAEILELYGTWEQLRTKNNHKTNS